MAEKHWTSGPRPAGVEASAPSLSSGASLSTTASPIGRRRHTRHLSFVADQRVADRYQIVRFVGSGGMGEVYEAFDEELAVPVALKALRFDLAEDPRALWHLKREVLLTRSITHPHVCRVYDLGRHGDGSEAVWFLSMELLRGETLGERVRRGPLRAMEALPLVEQMVAGLAAAHRAGIVHRDFKSGNVMLVDGGARAVVTDFGLARNAGGAPSEAGDASRVAGTPAYMAPEQARGEEAGPAADIYALGVVLYEMVTGRLPFAGRRLLPAHFKASLPPPPPRSVVAELEEHWEEAILRCLAPEPTNRFARAEEVAETLARRTPEAMRPVRFVLPAERDAFVGREAELDELARRLGSGARLMTLLGAAGMGKTRLAVRYAWQHLHAWPGGVWFCDLTEARGVDGIVSAVGEALGVPLGKEDPVLQLGHAIAGRRRCLVVLDNFEQVAEHAGVTVEPWLERAVEARFVVTSRERLRVRGEEVLGVEPLGIEAGVDLFAERARRHRPGFEPREAELESVREVVRWVEGMPLAIELAAARVRVMAVSELVARMRDRFRVLGGGGGDRHGSLRAAIAGSWELLQEWEKAALAQCAVFEGGFTLEAAEGVLDLGAWPEAPWVVDVVQSLVDKCVVRMWVPESGVRGEMPAPRFGMYVSVQEYAREQLGEMGVEAERGAEERHGRWYARYGTDEALAALERHGGIARLRELERELDNLVVACRRAVTRGDGATAGAAYGAAGAVLTLRGPFGKSVALGRSVLEMELDREARARALQRLGMAELSAGPMEEARAHFESALADHRELGNRRAEGIDLGNLGLLNRNQGRMEEARDHYEAALAIHREVSDRSSEGIILGNLGLLHLDQSRMEEARAHFEAALAIHREVGNRRSEGIDLGNLGLLHLDQGRTEEARTHFESALAIHRELGHRRAEGIVLRNLGLLNRDRGRMEEARAQFEAALAIHRELGYRLGEGTVLGNLGGLHDMQGRIEEARTHLESAIAIHREVGNRRSEGIDLSNLGGLHHDQGRMEEARATYEAALAIHRELGNRRSEGFVLGYLGSLQHDQGRMEEARAYYEAALAILREVGNRHFQGSVLGRLGNLHRKQGRIEESKDAIERAEAMLREVGDPIELAKVLCIRAELEQETGNVAAARASLHEAQQLAERAGAGPESDLGRLLVNARQAIPPLP